MNALGWVVSLARTGRGRMVLAVVFGSLASGAAIGLTATSAWLISRASQQPPVLDLMVAIVAVRALGLGRGVFRYVERLVGHDAAFRTLGDLRVATVVRLERVLPIRSSGPVNRLTTGELLSRFVDDVDGLMDLWVRVIIPSASTAVVGAATIGLIALLLPSAAVALGVSLVVAAIVAPWLSARRAQDAGVRLMPLRARYQSGVLDLLDGATELAVYGALDRRLERLGEIDSAIAAAESRSALAAGRGAAIAAFSAGAAVWCGLWFGSDAVEAGSLASVSLAVVVLVPLAAHEVVSVLLPAAREIPALAGSARRVREVFDQPDSVQEPDQPGVAPLAPLGLHIVDLHARWTPDGPEVLAGVDLDVEPGTRLVVTGSSGTGKSTLAAVLLRLLDPSGGHVELVGRDGSIDIASLSGDDVRRAVGWLAQDAYVFDSTIEANLRLARPDATESDMLEALRRAGLRDWLATLPHGLTTMIGEHGGRVSGGQRQRLALARVLLADRPIVVFDEPTEHLDETAAQALAADLLTETGTATVIIVTHRPDLFEGRPGLAVRRVHLADGRLEQR